MERAQTIQPQQKRQPPPQHGKNGGGQHSRSWLQTGSGKNPSQKNKLEKRLQRLIGGVAELEAGDIVDRRLEERTGEEA